MAHRSTKLRIITIFLPWFLDTGQTSVTRRFMSKIAQNGALLNKIFLSVEITDKNMEI
jgi:hypothetical protein